MNLTKHWNLLPLYGVVLLLASDGLTGMLEDEQLVKILADPQGPQAWRREPSETLARRSTRRSGAPI